MSKVLLIMGSKADMGYSQEIADKIKGFGVECILRIASAHKTPQKVLEIIGECEGEACVIITVAGRSNALSGFVDANTTQPVIASPPYSMKFAGMDILSSLRMPSGVSPLTVLGAEQAALAAAKILALNDSGISKKVKEYQEEKKKEIEDSDKEIQS